MTVSFSGYLYLCFSMQRNCSGGVFGDNSGISFLISSLKKNICCGYSLDAPRRVPTTYFFMEILRKLSQNYHQILLLTIPLVCLISNIF